MSVSDILYIKTQMVTGFEALSKKAYPVIIYDSRFSHFYRMVSFYVAFNVVRFQMSWLFLACCFQRATFSNLHPGFDDVVFNVICCSMLPDVTFNVAMLPITCTTLKNNEANIPHKTVVIPGYCYIILQKLTSVCHQFCSYIQRSHVAYVQADFGNVTHNIPCCLMFTRFLATLFSTYHVGLNCGCFFQLSSIFGCLAKKSHLISTFGILVRISMLSAKYGSLTEYFHLSSKFGCLVKNAHLTATFASLVRISMLSGKYGSLTEYFHLSSKSSSLAKNSHLTATFASLVRISMLSGKSGSLTEKPLLSSVFSHLLAKFHLNSNIANSVPFFL